MFMAKLTINTTQNIKIEFKSASLGERIIAFVLDNIFKLLYLILVSYIINKFRLAKGFDDNWSEMAFWIISFSPVFFYTLFFESIMQGATPGKKIMHIRVIKIDGYEASIVDYATRWVMGLIDFWMMSGAIGVISIASSPKSQRLGDILAGTSVISIKERVPLSATIFQEVASEYVPLFPQVLNLSDKDVYIIKEALLSYKQTKDHSLLQKLVSKVESVIGVGGRRSTLTDLEFIEAVLKDYNQMTAKI